jgi:hypothetical protein
VPLAHVEAEVHASTLKPLLSALLAVVLWPLLLLGINLYIK